MPQPPKVSKFVVLPLILVLLILVSTTGYRYYTGTLVIRSAVDLLSPAIPKTVSKLSIAFVEDGDSASNRRVLRNTLAQLVKLGWFAEYSIPCSDQFKDCIELWYWACNNLESDYIKLEEAHIWSFEWDERNRQAFRDQLAKHTTHGKLHVDLIIGMGNITGHVLSNGSLNIPIVILNSRNPEEAGYTQGDRFSNRSNVFVAINSSLSDQQIRMFYNVTKFKTLGIIYRNTRAGRADAGLSSINRLASEYGFKVLPKELESGIPMNDAALVGIRDLVTKVDALFIPELPGINYQTISQLNTPILAQGIPTFSQQGVDLVEQGLLTTYTYSDYSMIGLFYASVISKILNGVSPDSIPQYYESDLEVYINSATAKQIDFLIPPSIRRSANTIFSSIMDKSNAEVLP